MPVTDTTGEHIQGTLNSERLFAKTAWQGTVLVNGGLETDVVRTGLGFIEPVGWTNPNPEAGQVGLIEVWAAGPDYGFGFGQTYEGPVEGFNFVEIDNWVGLDGLLQVVNTTAGQDYVLEFFSKQRTIFGTNDALTVMWDGAEVGFVRPANIWQKFSITLTASSDFTQLSFSELDGESLGYSVYIDAISLTAIRPLDANASIDGLDGNDTLIGARGADTLMGSGGDDLLVGSYGQDSLLGGDGDDTLLGDTAAMPVSGAVANGPLNVSAEGWQFSLSEADQFHGVAGANPLSPEGYGLIFNGGDRGAGDVASQTVATSAGAAYGLEFVVGAFGDQDQGIHTLLAEVVDRVSGAVIAAREVIVPIGYAQTIALEYVAISEQVTIRFTNTAVTNTFSKDLYVNAVVNQRIDANVNQLGDFLSGDSGNDLLQGGLGNDTILGGEGDDTARITLATDGADQIDLGAGNDRVMIDSIGIAQLRVTFTSAEVGNGNANESNTVTGQDGALAVRLQAEAANGDLMGDVTRLDDEGIRFTASSGSTFDVRDITGTQRGNQFVVVQLGTTASDIYQETGATGAIYINAGQGNDTLIGGGGADFLVGGLGHDSIIGDGGNDTALGGDGNDVIRLGDGDDVAIGGNGNDALDGGAGRDTASYAGAVAGVTVSLASTRAQATIGAGNDVLNGFENLIGSSFGDMLSGNAIGNMLTGGAGNDTLTGADGVDSLVGGDGDDILISDGTDSLAGGSGSDLYLITAANAADTFALTDDGGMADEIRFASNVKNATFTLRAGMTGIETIAIGTGTAMAADTRGGKALNVDASAAANSLRINGNDGANRIMGGVFADVIMGGNGADSIDGGSGGDLVDGGAGDDQIASGRGDDTIMGGAGVDTVNYRNAVSGVNVSLTATAAQDTGFGMDVLSGVENLSGSDMNDTLQGDGGNNVLIGGNGIDTVSYADAMGGVRVSLANARAQATGGAGNDKLSGFENLTGSNMADMLTGDANANSISGLGGDDTLNGGAGADTLLGGAGNDRLMGGTGADSLSGGAGSDLYIVSDADRTGAEVFDNGAGMGDIDELRLETKATDATLTVFATEMGLERVSLGAGTRALNIDASASSSGLMINGNDGANRLSGSAQSDTIMGGGGRDVIVGGGGDDRINGNFGSDMLTGGAGADTFVFDTALLGKAGFETITDFNSGEDKIELSRAVYSGIGASLDMAEFYVAAGATTAGDASDRLIYDQSSGHLFYDADGLSSIIKPVVIAKFTAGTTLEIGDFLLV